MKASAWFNQALDAEARAYRAKTIEGRRRHGQCAIDALGVAASLGYHDAVFKLGIYYKHGEFGILPVRLDLAEHWLRLAVTKKRDGTAMLALAILLMETARKAEGRKWLRAALAHGEGGAACHLGREIEAKSPSRALRLYLKGVTLGDPFAALCAGRVLETRKSREALLQARDLFKKALRKQITGADESLERVRRKLQLVEDRGPRPAGKRRARREGLPVRSCGGATRSPARR